jgi:acetyl esterase/lipase
VSRGDTRGASAESAPSAEVPRHPPGMSEQIATALREIGPRIAGPETIALYAPLQPAEPYAGVSVERDLSYGPYERNVLDVFTTPVHGSGKPVVVFLHGGGFARGQKRTPDTPFYDNVMLWAVGQGFVGVNVNYRLAPEHRWPSGIEDLTRIADWVGTHAPGYGGSPRAVIFWGHSAGAAHVADYLAHAALRGRDAKIAGAVLTSGFYDLGHEVSVWKAYYGDDVSTYAERSSLPGLLRTPVPLLVTDAELDPEMFRTETSKLVNARAEIGRPVLRVHLPNHSHLSETYAVGTGDRSLSAPVADFVGRIARGRHSPCSP